MNTPQAIYFLNEGLELEVYGDKLLLCKDSPTGLKVELSNGASYYAEWKDIRRATMK